MAIELNNPIELNKPIIYKEFFGSNNEQMSKLIAEGRTPMSFKGIMQRCLEVANSNYPDLVEIWFDNYFDTGDACAIDSKGNLKVVLDSNHLRELNLETELINGAIVLSNAHYSKLGGEEFDPKIIKRYGVEEPLTEKQVNEHPVWLALARGDEALLKAYSQMIFAKAKEGFGLDKNMSIHLPSTQRMSQLRSWCAYGLGYRSNAGGGGSLGGDCGRFVGIMPEVLVAKNLESKIMR